MIQKWQTPKPDLDTGGVGGNNSKADDTGGGTVDPEGPGSGGGDGEGDVDDDLVKSMKTYMYYIYTNFNS